MVTRRMQGFLTLVALAALVSGGYLIPRDSSAIQLTNLELVFEKSFREALTVYSYGRSISSAGDVNGDGYDDVIVAFAFYDNLIPLRPWLAQAFIFFGGAPMDTDPDIILSGDHDGVAWVEVAGVGDVNSDGFDDVVLSNRGDRGVRLFFGGNPMDTIYDVLLLNETTRSLASSVSHAGDVNGDGYHDVVVGNYTTDGLNGSAAIFFGGLGMDSLPDVLLRGSRREGFGTEVGGGGNLNCDGYDDVIVGELDNSEFAPNAGKVYVFYGGSPMDTIPDVWLYGEGASHQLGWFELDILEMTGICDWVVAGTSLYPYGFPAYAPGKVYVLFGDTLMDGTPDASIIGKTDTTSLGECSVSGGRPAGGSFDALLSGAPTEYGMRGSVYLWLCGIPFDTIPDAVATGSFPEQSIGWDVACAGDVNGDGHDEIMFSNSATLDTIESVWICRYTGTGVSETNADGSDAGRTALLQSYPNPFTGMTTIRFRMLSDELRGSSLDVYDSAGRHVKSLWRGDDSARGAQDSEHSVQWDGKDTEGRSVPAGVYFCRLSARRTNTRKMVLVR